MAKKKKSPSAMDILQLDMQQRDRELAAQLAIANMEINYKNKMMELVDIPALDAQKDQFAKQYALEQAKLDFQKTMAEREFGESQRRWDIDNDLNQRRFQLDQNAQEFQQRIQTGQLALDEASITGFFNGQPTMQRIQMEAGLTGFHNGQKTFERERWETDTELRKAENVLNAPRGPADYAAYLNRLYGLQQRGMTPGVVGDILTGMNVGTAGAMQGNMPISNTQFAQALMYGQQGQQVSPQIGGSPGVPNTQQAVDPNSIRDMGRRGLVQNPEMGGSPEVISPSEGNRERPVNFNEFTGEEGNRERPINFNESAGGAGNPTQQASPTMFSSGQMIKSGGDVNFRDWQRMTPVAQEYTKGYAAENLGIPEQDFIWGIAQGAPTLQRGSQGRRGIF